MNNDSGFIYSGTMQLILFFISCLCTVLNYISITNLILTIYGQKVSRRRKILFAVIVALGLNQFWVYGIFALGKFQSFSPLAYVLIVSPNPFLAMIYYWIGIYVLHLSKYRCVRLMRVVYIYVLILRCFGEIIGVFVTSANADSTHYNFLLDAVSSVLHTILCLLLYGIIIMLIRKLKFQVRLFESLPINNLGCELLISWGYASFLYLICIAVPHYLEMHYAMKLEGYMLVALLLILFLTLNFNIQHIRTMRHAIDNKKTNINVLMAAIDNFAGLKHDFFNILQTYEGYLTIGDLKSLKKYHQTLLDNTIYASEKLDMAYKVSQNSALTALLVEKQQFAADAGFHLSINISCDIENLYIPIADLCHSISLLLDIIFSLSVKGNTIIFSVEQKTQSTKLIMVNGGHDQPANAGISESKSDALVHGSAVQEVRKLLYKYNNVFFHGTFNDDNIFAYIELSCPRYQL